MMQAACRWKGSGAKAKAGTEKTIEKANES